MKVLKKMLALILAAAVVTVSAIPAWAAETKSDATICGNLGVLVGSGGGITASYLKQPTVRIQAAVMFLRLKGLEETAKAYKGTAKFADKLPGGYWAAAIMGYLKANPDLGWNGDNKGRFNPETNITAQEYYKVMLEALGYKQGVDFIWSEVIDFARVLGMYGVSNVKTFTNNDVATATVEALKTTVKGDKKTLVAVLAEKDKNFAAKAAAEGLVDASSTTPVTPAATPVSAAALAPVSLNVGDDAQKLLPATVNVTYSDNTTKAVKVTWPTVSTAAPAPKTTIQGALEGITAFKAQVDVTVNAVVAGLDSVTAVSLGELTVKFTAPVNSTQLNNIANYTVKVGTTVKTVAAAVGAADNKSVTLTLAEASAFAQQDKVDVTIGSAILPQTATASVASVVDVTIPQVTSVTAVGNKQIRIVFSEPMKKATAITLANYKLDGNLFNGYFEGNDLSADRKTLLINVSSRLAAGTHVLAVFNVQDYASYPIASPSNISFTVTDDRNPPAIDHLVSASQTSLVVQFTKEIETPVLSSIIATQGTVTGVSVSGKVLTVTFSSANPLPIVLVTVTFNNITDLNGNVAPSLSLPVTAVADTVRPAVLSVTPASQSQITVQYSKNVLLSGGLNPVNPSAEYAMKDAAGTSIPVAASFGANHSVVILSPSAGGSFTAGSYTVYISGVMDDNPLKNLVLPASYPVVIPDTSLPAIVTSPAANSGIMIDTVNNKLYVKFTEAVNPATASVPGNYTYVSGGIIKTLSAGTSVQLMPDGRTVCLAFQAAETLVASITTLQVANVTDISGNVMNTQAVLSPFTAVGAAPAMIGAKVIGPNSIRVTLSGPIIDATRNPSDFLIQNNNPAGAETLYAVSATYDDGVTTPGVYTLTLTTQQTISNDSKYNGYTLKISTVAATNAYNAYGQKLVGGTVINPITDAYTPTGVLGAARYVAGTGTVIDVNINKLLAYAAGTITIPADKAQFVVKLNNVAKPFSVVHLTNAVAGYPSTLRFTIQDSSPPVSTVGATVRVIFNSVPAPATIYDASTNPLADFDLTGTIQ